MESRGLVLGLVTGATVVGVGSVCARWPSTPDRPLIGGAAAAAERSGTTSADDRDDELERLRAEVERLRAMRRREPIDDANGSGGSAQAATPTDAAPSDPIVAGDIARALDVLLAELTEQTTTGVVRERFKANTHELAMFVLQTWVETGRPERALRVLELLRSQGFDAGTAVWIASALHAKGDKALAREALLLGLSIAPTDWSAVQMLAEVDPDAALEAQSRLLAGVDAAAGEADLQRATLLLAARRRDAALALIDTLIGNGRITDYVWDQLVAREPAAAVERLRKVTQAQPDDLEQRMRLANALGGAGENAAARSEIAAIMKQWPDAYQAISTLGAMDRGAALAYLESRLAVAPTAHLHGWYGEQLAEAGRKDEAIQAYWQAWRADPGSGWEQRLLALAPARYSRQLADVARSNRDDETLGDIADALWSHGSRDEAVGLWREAASIDPEDGEWTGKLRDVAAGRDPLQ